MNRISLYFFITFLVFTALFSGCGTPVIKDIVLPRQEIPDEAKKKQAIDKFLNGAAFESKGDYASAILEYQEALALYPSAGICYSLAKNYFALQKLAPASNFAKQAIAFDSSNVEYYALLQDIYAAALYSDSSVTILEKILQLDPKNVEARYELARSYENNRPKQAITLYNEILAMTGKEWSVLTRLIELYEKIEDSKGVLTTIEDLLELDGSNVFLKKLKIDYLVKNQQDSLALQAVDEFLQLYPKDNEVLLKKAAILYAKKEYSKAAGVLQVLSTDTSLTFESRLSSATTLFNLAILDSNIIKDAERVLLELDKDSADANVKLLLGGLAEMKRNDSSAMKYFQEVTVLAPWNVEAWLGLGEKYLTNKKYDEALRTLRVADTRFPDNFGILLMLGFAHLEQEHFDSAVVYLRRAIQQNGRSPEALHSLGYALSQLDKTDEAIAYVERALLLSPKNVGMYGTLASLYEKAGNFVKTDSLYLEALTIDSLDALINNNYAYSLSQRDIRLNEALSRVNSALSKDSLNSSYLDTKGWIYYKMGDYTNAIFWLEAALKQNADKAVLWDHLGDAFFRAEMENKAKEAWQKALDLDPGNNEILKKLEKGLQ